MKKIESKKDIKLFRKEIKKELNRFITFCKSNLPYCLALELLNDDDDYICHMFARAGMAISGLERITYDSISVANFMYGNGFDLNKETTYPQLMKVVDRIIDEYNDEVEYQKIRKLN